MQFVFTSPVGFSNQMPAARSAWRLSSLLASKTYTIADVWRCIDLPAGACY
jgi:hypothetical protein